MIEAEQLHARILDELDLSKEVEDEELTRIIYRVLRCLLYTSDAADE